MNRHTSIKAIFFMSIFSLMMLHSLVPHVHHNPEQHAEADHTGAHHHHTQDTHHQHHDHDHSSFDEEGGEGFLLHLLLGSHAHSFHAHDYNSATKWQVKKRQEKSTPLTPRFDYGGVSPPCEAQYRHFPYWHQDALFDDPLLCTRSMRAPPSLV